MTHSIPFIRAFPNGRQQVQTIRRPIGIHLLACQFLTRGGRYLIAAHGDGTVELVAATAGQGELCKLAEERVENGPALIDAVDRLVRASVERLNALDAGVIVT